MSIFRTSREIPASREQVYAAIREPERLARWWGPAGFTNTFHVCEFTKGGRWSFVMHGPNGHDYPNENVFEEIAPLQKIVIRHLSEPKFRLTIGLAPAGTGTEVLWEQAFDDAEITKRVEAIVVPANEQNLDRLTSEVLS